MYFGGCDGAEISMKQAKLRIIDDNKISFISMKKPVEPNEIEMR